MRIDPAGLPLATLKLDLALEVLASRRPAELPARPPVARDALTMTDAARALAAGAPSPAVLKLLVALVDRASGVRPAPTLEAPVAADEGVRTVVVTAHTTGAIVSIELSLRPAAPQAPDAASPIPFEGGFAQLDGHRFLLLTRAAGAVGGAGPLHGESPSSPGTVLRALPPRSAAGSAGDALLDPAGPLFASIELAHALEVLVGRPPIGIAAGAAPPMDALTVADVARALAAGAPTPAVLKLLTALADQAAAAGPTLAIEARVATNEGVRTILATAHVSGALLSIEVTLRPDARRAPVALAPVPFEGEFTQLDGQRYVLPLVAADHPFGARPEAILEQSLLAALVAIQPPARGPRRDRPRRRPASNRADAALASLLRSMGRSPDDDEQRLDRPA